MNNLRRQPGRTAFPARAWIAATSVTLLALIPAMPYAQDDAFQDDLQALVDEISAQSESATREPLTLDLNASLAQNAAPAAPAIEVEGGAVTLNFQDADISALINSVSQITGRNFIVDPRVKGKVTLVSGTRLKTEQVFVK